MPVEVISKPLGRFAVSPATAVYGCCTNQMLFPLADLAHDGVSGGNEDLNVEGSPVDEQNVLKGDILYLGLPTRLSLPCGGGGFTLNIPWYWYAGRSRELHPWLTALQVMSIQSDGTVSISKHGTTISRNTNGDTSW